MTAGGHHRIRACSTEPTSGRCKRRSHNKPSEQFTTLEVRWCKVGVILVRPRLQYSKTPAKVWVSRFVYASSKTRSSLRLKPSSTLPSRHRFRLARHGKLAQVFYEIGGFVTMDRSADTGWCSITCAPWPRNSRSCSCSRSRSSSHRRRTLIGVHHLPTRPPPDIRPLLTRTT